MIVSTPDFPARTAHLVACPRCDHEGVAEVSGDHCSASDAILLRCRECRHPWAAPYGSIPVVDANTGRQPWERFGMDGELEALCWGRVMRERPELSFGFLCRPGDYCEYRMLAAGGSRPDEHPWSPYRISPDVERRCKGPLVFQETT